MSYIYDYDAMMVRYRKEAELRRDGKACPKCECYRIYENPKRGQSKGYCTRSQAEKPDRPAWWGKAQDHVCADFKEATNGSPE